MTVCAGVLCCSLFFSSGTSVSAGRKAEAVTVSSVKIKKASGSKSEPTDLIAENPNFTFTITSQAFSMDCQSYTYSLELTDESAYFLGYYGEDNYKPLLAQFSVTKTNGTKEVRTQELELKSSNAVFDSIGTDLAGTKTYTNSADLLISEGEKVDVTTFALRNVYKPVLNASGNVTRTPDFSKEYIIANPTLGSGAGTNYDLEDFLNVEFTDTATFSGYKSLNGKYHSDAATTYRGIYSGYVRHRSRIEDGSEYLRVRFTGLTESSIQVTYEDGEVQVIPILGTDAVTFSEDGTFRFLLNNLSSKKVRSFALLDTTITVDIVSTSNHKTITGSARAIRFGTIPFVSEQAQVRNISFDLIFWLTLAIYTVVFAVCDYFLYRYRKNKYKNDEFKRVDNKHYLKRSLLAFAYLGLWAAEIVVLIGRTTKMHNTFVVKNPFDVWIVIFSVALIIFSGYYIKYFINLGKAHKTRKKEAKLKLDQDKDDDGTN